MKQFRVVCGQPVTLRFDRFAFDVAGRDEGGNSYGTVQVLRDGEVAPLVEVDIHSVGGVVGVEGVLGADMTAALDAGIYWLKASYRANDGLRSESAKLLVERAAGDVPSGEPGELIIPAGFWAYTEFNDLDLLLDRWDMASCELPDGRVFCFGGRGLEGDYNDVLLVDVAQRAVELLSIAGSKPSVRIAASCCELDGYVYMLGGATWDSSGYGVTGDFWCFDLSAGAWERLPNNYTTNFYQQNSSMTAWGGELYVFPKAFGVDITSIGINKYNPVTGTWQYAYTRPPIGSIEGQVLVGDYWYFIGSNESCRLDMHTGDYELGPTIVESGVTGGAVAYGAGYIHVFGGRDYNGEQGLDHTTRVLRLDWDQSRWVRLEAANAAPSPTRQDALLLPDGDSGFWLIGGTSNDDFWSPELSGDYVHWVAENAD